MENKDQSERHPEDDLVSESLFDIIADMLQGSLPLCTPETDLMSSLGTSHFVQQCKTDGEDRRGNRGVKHLCTLFFQEHDNLQLFDMELWKIEMHAIFEAIVKCNYNCAQAARKLGICDRTLYNKLKMYRHRLLGNQL